MNISIIGLGLLGGSLALQAKEQGLVNKVIGVDINPAHQQKALELGIVDCIASFEEAVKTTQLIVLATPVDIILQQLPQVLDLINEDAIVIDLGSTKEMICKAVEHHPRRGQYVAAHPIAGTENSGPEAAFASLLRKKIMILCNKEQSYPQVWETVTKLCEALGMRLSIMDAAEHDLHLAYVSHLSHISSFALGITVLDKEKDEKSIFEMAGSGFSSTVRLAKSSPSMWAPIFTQNTQNISSALDAYIKQLQLFKEIIDNQDQSQSKELMQHANEIRRVLQGIDDKLAGA